MKTVLLTSLSADHDPDAVSSIERVLRDSADDLRVLALADTAIGACLACGNCNAAGRCVLRDEMTEILPEIASCDLLVLATSIVFGVHHPLLKLAVDRLMPLGGGRFAVRHGEMHHAPRHPKRFALVGIGLLEASAAPGEADTFERLIGRHAINLACSDHVAVVVRGDADAKGAVRSGLARLGVDR